MDKNTSSSPFSKRGSSNFASGFDRWLALQDISEKMSRRAGTLNAMEKLRLDRATKQIDFKLNMSESHYTKVCDRLKDTLKNHDLYKRALNRSRRRVYDEVPEQNAADMNSPGRYQRKTFRTLEDDIKEEENEIRERRMRRNAKLLEESRKESETLIDRRVPTYHLLKNKGAPLSERLRTNAKLHLQMIKPKIQVLVAFTDLRENAAKRKQTLQKGKVKMTSKGTFQSEVTDT
ncbi:uncharacterized protein [Amphiura filiformis]|uniref:uncharacterized protein n=1 Tax=Amphiura filiformis TaxID=82378 RepID=UPI003B215B21